MLDRNMYQKYLTDAFVLASREYGEADKMLALYTSEFGLVWARVGAVRKEMSKMRYALQTYSRANVSLIRGKHCWRIGGSVHTSSIISLRCIEVFARISQLVLRLNAVEERHGDIFGIMIGVYDILSANDQGFSLEHIEILCVSRILFRLGYLSEDIIDGKILRSFEYTSSDMEFVANKQDAIVRCINIAISETQL